MSSGVLPSFGKSRSDELLVDPQGYPCNAPPWAELIAISADTATSCGAMPLGEYKELTAKGIPKTGTP